LQAEGIFNPRVSHNLSGSLSVELWAFSEPGPSGAGFRLASSELEPLNGGASSGTFERRVAFTPPPAGRYQLALQLCEWTFSEGYVARDRRDFGSLYEQAAPEAARASEAQPVGEVETASLETASVETARPIERLRLVPPVAPEIIAKAAEIVPPAKVATTSQVAKAALGQAEEVATPAKVVAKAEATKAEDVATPAKVVAKAEATKADVAKPDDSKVELTKKEAIATASKSPGLVSIQTASVEELAKVKGLNLKIAKEIVKARPFASLSDLLRVRGVGQKTMTQLKGLLTL